VEPVCKRTLPPDIVQVRQLSRAKEEKNFQAIGVTLIFQTEAYSSIYAT
jgi:hypothetical protein